MNIIVEQIIKKVILRQQSFLNLYVLMMLGNETVYVPLKLSAIK